MLVLDAVLIGTAFSRHHAHVASSPPSAGRSADPSDDGSSGPSEGRSATGNDRARPTIELRHRAYRARPNATLRLVGRVRHTRSTSVAVQLRRAGSWISFPMPAVVDRGGRFVAYVGLGGERTYWVRIVDRSGGIVSKPARVSVR
jgi:hypothetical protein